MTSGLEPAVFFCIYKTHSDSRLVPLYKILVIEDDRAILNAVELHLRAEGYQVETATDGISGLGQAQGASLDLILLDLMSCNSQWPLAGQVRQSKGWSEM